jgi:dienelactone hydrolase
VNSLRERIQSFLKVSFTHSPPAVEFLNRQAEDGFTRCLVRYAVPDGDQIEAFLFQPELSNSRGAVLALHQHNSQWEIGKSEIAGLIGDPFQAFGPALARRGVTVLAPDSIGFESRLKRAGWGDSLAPSLSKPHSTNEGWLQYYNQMAHRLVAGDLLIRKILEDSATGVSLLESISGTQHLGVIGHSFGGSTALFLAALDTRIAFSCASGSVCSFRHKLKSETGLEMSLIIPGFCESFDFDDLIRCIAPRKLLVVSSVDDPLSGDAEDLVRAALPAFEKLNCADHLQHLRTAGGHTLERDRFEAIIGWAAAQANRAS